MISWEEYRCSYNAIIILGGTTFSLDLGQVMRVKEKYCTYCFIILVIIYTIVFSEILLVHLKGIYIRAATIASNQVK